MKSICLFNHKGGVSKTTTAFNLGWCMADRGKRVLLVDLDSQCNLTGLVLGFSAIDDNRMESFYSNRDILTLRPIVEKLINGVAPERFLESETGKPHTVKRPRDENLMLLPGHLDISDLDSQISVSLKIASGIPATRNIPGNLPQILQLLADRHNVDYVIYDLSPNVGGLNEVVLMSSDYFIVPASPDFFCLQAIDSLKSHIVKWHAEIEQFKKIHNFQDRNFPIRNSPEFIGVIQQRYRPRHEKPAKSFEKWIDQIRGAINGKLVPALEPMKCVVDAEKVKAVLAGSDLKPYDLAQIPDFNSLIAISQHHSKPVFALTDGEVRETGKVFGHAENTMLESRDRFNRIFMELSNRVLTLTDG